MEECFTHFLAFDEYQEADKGADHMVGESFHRRGRTERQYQQS